MAYHCARVQSTVPPFDKDWTYATNMGVDRGNFYFGDASEQVDDPATARLDGSLRGCSLLVHQHSHWIKLQSLVRPQITNSVLCDCAVLRCPGMMRLSSAVEVHSLAPGVWT